MKEQLEVNDTMVVLNFIIKENFGRWALNLFIIAYLAFKKNCLMKTLVALFICNISQKHGAVQWTDGEYALYVNNWTS